MLFDYDIDKIYDMFDKQIEILSQLINNIETKLIIQEKKIQALTNDTRLPSGIIHNVNDLNDQVNILSDFVDESSDILNQQIDSLFEIETSVKDTVIEHDKKIDILNETISQLTDKIISLNEKAQIAANFMKATTNILSDISSRISNIEDKINL